MINNYPTFDANITNPQGSKHYAYIYLILLFGAPISIFLFLKYNVFLEPLPIGSDIPSFSFVTSMNNTISSDNLKGKKYIMLFVSPACEHCKVEMKNYSQIKKDQNIIVIAISSGTSEFLKLINKQVIYEFILDSNNTYRQIFKITAVPSILFVSEEGKIAYRLLGERSFSNDSNLAAIFMQNKILPK